MNPSVLCTAFENVSFGFAGLDTHLTVRETNETLASMLHQQHNAIVGVHIRKIIPEMSSFSFTKAYEFNLLHRETGQTIAVDLIYTDGGDYPGYFMFCRDLTNYEGLKTLIDQLNDQTVLYNKMFNVLSDGIYISDGQGITLYVNDTFLQLSGLKRKDVIGKSVFYLKNNGIAPNSCTAMVVETKQPAAVINDYYDGKKCLVSGTPLFIDKELIRVVCVIRDVTELLKLQDMVEKEKSLALSYRNKLEELGIRHIDTNLIKTKSKSMHDIYDRALKVAAYDTPILLLGETGVGKDYLAHFIHQNSGRGDENSFVKVNCGAIPEQLLESELFGYEPGAFTGAQKKGKAGLFEIANNGTLYLDEIGDMPLPLQVKLLSVLQDKVIYRLGGTRTIKLNARIIAATNVDLVQRITEGKFRRDLYYRLNVITMSIPPLRNRQEDIVYLATTFLEQFNKQYNKTCCFSHKILELFLSYDWPGNIREIRNVVEHMVILANEDTIDVRSFDSRFLESLNLTSPEDYEFPGRSPCDGTDRTLREQMSIYEKEILVEAIRNYPTLKEAARVLDIDLSTLVRKQKKYNILKTAKEQ